MVSGRATYLTFICSFSNTDPKNIRFGSDGSASPASGPDIERLAAALGRKPRLIYAAADASAQQTARMICDRIETVADLSDLDFGDWRGRLLSNIAETEPDALQHWIRDPSQAPHGGESVAGFIARVRQWLDSKRDWGGSQMLVASSSVIKALVLATLDAPAASFWKLDIRPYTVTTLSSDGRRWAVQSVASSGSAA